MNLDRNFWNRRYLEGNTGWDVGQISSPLKAYFDQLSDKDMHILVPGGGNSYEAAYLYQEGFKNTIVIDISDVVIANFISRNPDFPVQNLWNDNFFNVTGSFDLVVEQTFFCALDPKLRPDYAKKVHDLLKPGGKLAGVLFDDPLNKDHPPFGGHKEEYLTYFAPLFDIVVLERCYNSIKPRAGRELFMILRKN